MRRRGFRKWIEELLDFSRIQDNRLTLIMDTIDILAELGETVLIYQERAKALGITLNYYEPKMRRLFTATRTGFVRYS